MESKKAKIEKQEVVNPQRQFTGFQGKIVAVFAILFSVFQIYANSIGIIQEIHRNAIHLGFLLVLSFLLFPGNKKSSTHKFSLWDILLAIGGVIVGLYIVIFYKDIFVARGGQANLLDYIVAGLAIVLTLIAGKRTIGWFIPILGIIFLLYARFGEFSFLGMFAHQNFTTERLLYRMYMTTEGLLGITISISSTYIFLFILFGAFLSASGAADLFNDLALAIAGKRRGGPAQVAILSSAMMGTLSGSAVANVATTGTFTIPLMKKIGYAPHFAGAVEAASSTGGMMMPPIMGAAAFIMAGFVGVPYSTVMLAAVIPALLYYAGVIIMVDIEAKRLGLSGLSAETLPRVWDVLKKRGLLLIPIIVIVWTLFEGRTPLYAGFAGIISTILASWFHKDTRIGPKKILQAFEEAGRGAIQVGIATAATGIIVGVVGMTGVGSVLAYNILKISFGQLSVALVLVMLTAIVLSLGLPSTALYIVVAVTAAPALVEAGIPPLAAHFFVFWFGVLSNVTPPVALASYTAGGIAGADPMKTGWTGLKLTIAGFIIPFMFAYNPVILMQTLDGSPVSFDKVILAAITGLFGVFSLAVAVLNYYRSPLNWLERILFFLAAIFMIKPGIITDAIGIGLLVISLFIQIKKQKEVINRGTNHEYLA
ncbi:TRAP transporter permease [Tepidibacillus sp. HK-1]|uniref:TRAP transporter permease n=1 Tax=Tepidibacillus sp. HK-1 TaxID=1883407 RepID=UPI000853DF4D|nr:TRAP transporter permease [Tepidibacillus sp. HK-1]GBF12340.1 sialic acid TRAP transporter permease protein SiaT [Tepidibacillus sp. HK-1]